MQLKVLDLNTEAVNYGLVACIADSVKERGYRLLAVSARQHNLFSQSPQKRERPGYKTRVQNIGHRVGRRERGQANDECMSTWE